MVGLNPSTVNQVHSVWEYLSLGTDPLTKTAAMQRESSIESPTAMEPMEAAVAPEILLPRIMISRKPAKGRAGISQSSSNMSAPHGTSPVYIDRLVPMVKPENEGKAD